MNNYLELNSAYTEKPDYYYSGLRSEMIPFLPTDPKTVLDVGCSSGNFGAEIKKRFNCIVWGIEPNEDAVKEAAVKLDYVIHGVFDHDHPALNGKKFDAIIFNDVLEHLINPYEVLNQCKSFLNPGGCIVASIPNILYFHVMFIQIIVKGDWKYEKHGILDKTHLRFFTRKSIIRMFEEQGYMVEIIKGISPDRPISYRILNLLLLNRLKDWKYLQFGIRAIVKK